MRLFILSFISFYLFLDSAFANLQSSTYSNQTETTNYSDLINSTDTGFLPVNWTWADNKGKNLVTFVRNQNIPNYCISGWIMSTVGMLADRIKIMRSGAWPDFILSPQFLLSCDQFNMGCNGGTPVGALEYIYNYSIPDESCSSYVARGWTNGMKCEECEYCTSCNVSGQCHSPDSYNIYQVAKYGTTESAQKMQQEIYQRGPIACAVVSTPLKNYKGGIIDDHSGLTHTDHYVELIGWGQTSNGTKYWIAKNSWGSFWGEEGYFRVVRGTNNLGIESNCAWAVPNDTWTDNVKNKSVSANERNFYNQDYVEYYPQNFQWNENSGNEMPNFLSKEQEANAEVEEKQISQNNQNNGEQSKSNSNSNSRESSLQTSNIRSSQKSITLSTTPQGAFTPCYIKDSLINRNFIKSNDLPWAHIQTYSLPSNFDWRNKDGVNFVSAASNQFNPQYCQSCWAFAVLEMLADRAQVLQNISNFRPLTLSTQMAINCQAGGDCGGGDPLNLLKFIANVGVPEGSCQNYEGENPDSFSCTGIQLCEVCGPPIPPPNMKYLQDCKPIDTYESWYVNSYGVVSGVNDMMQAIYAQGPITCSVAVTEEFRAYSKGIFTGKTDDQYVGGDGANHVITIVGWGEDSGQSYWIGRNSWGSFWGELGFFRMAKGINLLGIESDCVWGIPSKTKPNIVKSFLADDIQKMETQNSLN